MQTTGLVKHLNTFQTVCVTLLLAGATLVAQAQQQQQQPPTPGGGDGGRGRGPGGPGGPGGFFGGGFGGPGGFGRGRIIDPPDDFIRPPSMRIGLLTVLKQVGGPEAEQAVAEVLKTTARGVELAYATHILETLAPGKYRNDAIAGAKELLTNPIEFPNPSRYDRDAKGYLYGVLWFYKDTSFVPTAQTLLVTAEGRIDGTTLEYLNRTMEGSTIMPALMQAYYDARVTNQFDKMNIFNSAMKFTGMDQQANRMFTEAMSKEENGIMRFIALRGLTRSDNGGGDNETPPNQQVILARQQLLQSVAPSIQDERLQQVVNMTLQNLQNLAEGKPVQNEFGRNRGGPGGGPGARGGDGR